MSRRVALVIIIIGDEMKLTDCLKSNILSSLDQGLYDQLSHIDKYLYGGYNADIDSYLYQEGHGVIL